MNRNGNGNDDELQDPQEKLDEEEDEDEFDPEKEEGDLDEEEDEGFDEEFGEFEE
jgi:hypothetical protein